MLLVHPNPLTAPDHLPNSTRTTTTTTNTIGKAQGWPGGPGGHPPHSPPEIETVTFSIVDKKFTDLAKEISLKSKKTVHPSSVAEGFLSIAVESMSNAIKKISVQRGYDVSDYALSCFGGAGGQHACLVADRLGIKQIHLHP